MTLNLAVVPAILAFGVFVVFAGKEAGYPPTVWYPGTVFLLGLTAVVLWARAPLGRLGRPALVSLLFLAAFTAWTYLSIGWSEVHGVAWEGANKGLLYLLVYALFLATALKAETAMSLLAAYSLAVCVLGLTEFLSATTAANPDPYFIVGRFAEPTGYQNANCALFSMAAFPALFLASRRTVPIAIRASMFAVAGVLLQLALLSESRAWLVAFPVAFLLYVAIVPRRVRSLVFALPVAGALLAARPTLLDVFPAFQDAHGIHEALRAARGAILVSAAALLFLGAAMAAVDMHLWPAGKLGRRLAAIAAGCFGLAALVGVVLGLTWLGNPVTRTKHTWSHFKTEVYPRQTESHFTSGFGGRYELWRIGLRQVADHPVVGAGADNYAVQYLRDRRDPLGESLYPHSIELKILGQTGLVGGILFLCFLGSAVLAWVRHRGTSDLTRGVRAVALVAFAYWFLHGSTDWFWEEPGLGAPAFALLGLAVSTDGRRAEGATSQLRRRVAIGLGAVMTVAAAASLVAPWLSAKETEVALQEWRLAPARAFDRLDRARRLNPLTERPDVIAGAIASRLGEDERMAAAFSQALERNPENWYAHLELAVAYAHLGRRSPALRELRAAQELNPLEPTIPLVRRLVRQGRRISTKDLDRIFIRRIEFPLGKPH